MLRNKLVRSDGSIIDSSVIISCEYSEEVNSDNNLIVGDVTSSELTVEMLSTIKVQQDEMLTYYIIEDDVETLIGQFKVEKPTIASRTSIKFSAYDNIVKLERLFSDWLIVNQNSFPMTLLQLVQHACDYSGVTLATTDFPRHDMTVNAFYSDGLTSRQILSWAGAIAGRFIRANANGEIEFAWYTDADGIICAPGLASFWSQYGITITDDGKGNVSIQGESIEVSDDGNGNVYLVIPGATAVYDDGNVRIVPNKVIPYFQNGISYEDYTTDPIERVRINHSDSDVGIVFPQDATGNCFTISGNAILGACDLATVSLVAGGIYNTVSAVTYTPAKIRVPRTIKVRAGDIIRLITLSGEVVTTYAMRVSVSASGTNIESTGDKSYSTNAAVSSQTYSNMAGRMLAVTQTAEGLDVKNTDLEGRIARIGVSVQGLETTVLQTMNDLAALEGELETGLEEAVTSSVQTAKGLLDTASESFVSTDEFGTYQHEIATQFEQTASDIELRFNTSKTEIGKVDSDVKAKYEEQTKYIRFSDGNIVLGQTGSDILLIIKNDKISFVKNVKDFPEIAWFGNDILHVNEGEFKTELSIGKFAFKQNESGNLSFKKVVS